MACANGSNAAFTVVPAVRAYRASHPSLCAASPALHARACAEAPRKPNPTSISAPQQGAITTPHRAPSLFNGPEAVLGVLLAAVALLSDFARNFATLVATPRPASEHSKFPFLHACAHELQATLSRTRQLLEQSQHILQNGASHAADGDKNALLAVRQSMDDVMVQVHRCNQRAQQQLNDLQNALRTSSQNVLVQSSAQADAQAEVQRLRAELADKQASIDALTDQINRQQHLDDRSEQLEQVVQRLERNRASTEGEPGQTSGGGDPARSEMSLKEIKLNLKAEQLALSAEIAQAQVDSDVLSQDEVDALDMLKREMKAKKDLFKSRLNKAQTTVEKEEMNIERRDKAIDDVLHSIGPPESGGDEAMREDVVGEGDAAAGALSADKKSQIAKEGEPGGLDDNVAQESADVGDAENSADATKAGMQQQAVGSAQAVEGSNAVEKQGGKKSRARKRPSASDDTADDSAKRSTKGTKKSTRTRRRGRPPKIISE
ncbi:hypothetical protein BWQ96_02956 [Gracilariopsis chorda]|uniref:Uncharacterized protein n=1 Tax=Gracilariopsis chorda TaxID=448386 RepID=A0A2V3IYI3_9FLOR|nr:hypothetical protein BWQ96_02956 [Gracilariopsis chorda]|eukprot:PXF47181.1 hypothetical protein BWQ96_02956 [Gracilariopsis chorda]